MSASCPYCRSHIEAPDGMQVCPSCATPHHQDCFAENGGCTVFGCVSAPGDEPKIRVLVEDLGDHRPAYEYASATSSRTVAAARGHDAIDTHHAVDTHQAIDTMAEEEEPPRPSPFGVLLERAKPAPPSLPWGLMVLFSILSSGLFLFIWEFALARWLREVQPQNRAIYLYSAVAVLQLVTFASVVGGQIDLNDVLTACLLVSAMILLLMMGRFSMKKALEDYFDQAGRMGLCLDETLTFFFGAIYFQYHLNHVSKYKERREHAIA